jgi:hypothetical protein
MSSATFDLQHMSMISDIDRKNADAQAIIRRYAKKHALMDIAVGAASLLPGAALPAIFAAITLQNEKIYRPMAEELAKVYLTETDSYTDQLGNVASVATVALEFAQEFAIGFLVECAQELIFEAGLSAVATFIPVGGAVVAAGLDYCIAQMLTWQVGTMSAIYFQNGATWIESRKNTMGIAKELSGGVTVGVSQVWKAGKTIISQINTPPERRQPPESNVRVTLNDIPHKVAQVRRSGTQALYRYIQDLAEDMPKERVRQKLVNRGFASILIDAAMNEYYA